MGSTNIESPSTPAPQTTAESMADYVASLPALYETQMKYEPLMQAQNLAMLQQYGTQFGQAYKNVNDALYPETAKLQENLATQASQGMSSDMPQWAKDSYMNTVNANLGTNAGSPIAADYVSRGMLEQQKGWQDYYRNLGLSVAGRQPLAQGGTQSQLNYMQGYQPQQGLNYSANTYGNYSNAYANMYGSNAQVANSNPWASMIGGMGGATLGGMTGGMFGYGGSMGQRI
jgi:hypothetical protein